MVRLIVRRLGMFPFNIFLFIINGKRRKNIISSDTQFHSVTFINPQRRIMNVEAVKIYLFVNDIRIYFSNNLDYEIPSDIFRNCYFVQLKICFYVYLLLFHYFVGVLIDLILLFVVIGDFGKSG